MTSSDTPADTNGVFDQAGHLTEQALRDLDTTTIIMTICDQFLRTGTITTALRLWLENHYPTIDHGWFIDTLSFDAHRRTRRDGTAH